MRIGIFTDGYNPMINGVVVSINMLKEGLIDLGHQVFIVTTKMKNSKSLEKNEKNVVRFRGFPSLRKSFQGGQYVFCNKKILKKLVEMKFDVIHVHTEFSMRVIAYKLKELVQVPLVYTYHTMYEEYIHHLSKYLDKHFHNRIMSLVTKLTKKLVFGADQVIIPSKKVLNVLENKYKIQGNYNVVPTGLNLEQFQKNAESQLKIKSLKAQLGIKESDFVCLYTGRIAAEKSIDKIIRAFVRVREKHEAKLVIIGDGPSLMEYKKEVKKYRLENEILFLGFIKWEELGIYYQMADLFINASLSETQGLTIIEALASSLPVLCREDEAIKEIVLDGVNGLYYSDSDELAAKIELLINDSELRTKFKENARNAVLNLTKEEYAKNVLAVYQKAIGI